MNKKKYKDKLTKFLTKNHIKFTENDNSLKINKNNNNGFNIEIFIDENEIEISFSNWHKQFKLSEYKKTFRFILFGLSDNCRIMVKSKNEKDYYFQMQYYDGNEWIWDSETIYPIGKEYKEVKIDTKYLMNNNSVE